MYKKNFLPLEMAYTMPKIFFTDPYYPVTIAFLTGYLLKGLSESMYPCPTSGIHLAYHPSQSRQGNLTPRASSWNTCSGGTTKECTLVALGGYDLNLAFRLYNERLVIYFILEFQVRFVFVALFRLNVPSRLSGAALGPENNCSPSISPRTSEMDYIGCIWSFHIRKMKRG